MLVGFSEAKVPYTTTHPTSCINGVGAAAIHLPLNL